MIKKESLFLIFILFFFATDKAFSDKDRWSFTGDLSLKPAETIRSIAISPLDSNKIYAGNDTSIIFKSTNGGRTWSVLNGIRLGIEGTTKNKRITGIIIDPKYPDTLFAASDSGGVYRSYNGGVIWTKVGKPASGLSDTNVASIVMNPQSTQILYVNADSGVYKTLDRGATWFSVNNGLQQDSVNVNYIAIDPVNPNILYVGTSNGKIYRTENSGNSWSLVSQLSGSPNITAIIVDPKKPNQVYLGTQNQGAYFSVNRGLTFTNIVSGLPTPYPEITSVAIDTTSITKIYVGTKYRGVYKRLETDTSWTAINTGLTIGVTIVQTLAVNPSNPIYIYAGTQGEGIFAYTGNRAPILEDIPDKRITVGNTLVFDVIATDRDSGETQTLVYSVDTLVANQTFDHLYERKFRWTPDTSQAGYDTVIFTVMDQRGGVDRDTVVINVNRNPVLSSIANKIVSEGDSLNIPLSAYDPDGDSVNYLVSTIYPSGQIAQLPEGATFGTNGVFRWIPSYDIVSKAQKSVYYYVTFTATDNLGGSNSKTVQIKVNDKNRAPAFVNLPDSKTVNEGDALEFEVKAQDLDLDVIEYHTEGLSKLKSASFDSISSHIFSWIPSYTDSGSYKMIFILKDERGGTTRDTVNITVVDKNQPPVITNISDTTIYVNVNDSLIFYIIGADNDNDTLVYNVSGMPPYATYSKVATNKYKFRWIPNYTQLGTYSLKFNVQDGRGSSKAINVIIFVNHRPSFGAISDKTILERDSLYFTLSAIDLNRDTLYYSCVNPPSGAGVSTQDSIKFGWRPTYYQSGVYSVKFKVTDKKGGNDSVFVQINVINVNQRPVMTPITTKAINAGKNLQFLVRASDPDNDSLTYSASNLPSSASFDSSTQTFTWTPIQSQVGTYNVKFKATDKSSGTDSTIATIIVTDQNLPPEFTAIENKIIYENVRLIFAVVASDPNLDTLHYSVLGSLPSGAVFDSVVTPAPIFIWTPNYFQSGSYTVRFTVRDTKGLKDTVTVNIGVLNLNHKPVIIAPSDTSIRETQLLVISLKVSDSDNDPITVNAINVPSGAEFLLEGGIYKFKWTPNLIQQGVYSVSFSAVDTAGGKDTVTTVINVLNFNTAPLSPKIIFPKLGEEMLPTSYFVWERSYDPNVEDTVKYILEIDNNRNFTSVKLREGKIIPVISMSKIALESNSLQKVGEVQSEESVETVSIRLNELSGYNSLVDNMRYYWRVKAFDTGGDSSSYTSGLDSFVVNFINNNPNPPTKGFSPSNGKFVIDLNPVISWNPAIDPDVSDNSSKLKYWIQLSKDSTFTVSIFYQDTTDMGISSIMVSAQLEDEQAWFYRIKTIDDENATSIWSGIQKFYVNSKNNPPSQFGLVSPLNKASIDSLTKEIIFKWEKSSDSDPLSSISYTIEISSDTSFNERNIIYYKKDIPRDSNSVKVSTSLFQQNVYYWRVVSIDNNGLITYSNEYRSFIIGVVSSVEDDNIENEIPSKFSLFPNYPNPFNTETIIRYDICQSGFVSIKVFNILGQEIVTLIEKFQQPGKYSIKWDGRDGFGRFVASGVYIYAISIRNFNVSKKMVFLK